MSRLLNILSLILALASLISTSPTPYTDNKLSQIDELRARGVSEVSHSIYATLASITHRTIMLLPTMLISLCSRKSPPAFPNRNLSLSQSQTQFPLPLVHRNQPFRTLHGNGQ